MTRREFLATGVLLAATRCLSPVGDRRSAADGRLTARPGAPSIPTAPGRYPLGLGAGRDGILYIPRADGPMGLLLMLHGAGGRGRVSDTIQPLADEFHVAILAPDSRAATWDIVNGPAGPDVAFIDSALAHTFARCAVDRRRLAVGGFSDGASYALWLGITNGDLFGHVIAFSPGFLAPHKADGSPRIFISHGRRDEILPIDRTSRRLVPELEEAGYRVTYREFDGPHTVPPEIGRKAFEWLTK